MADAATRLAVERLPARACLRVSIRTSGAGKQETRRGRPAESPAGRGFYIFQRKPIRTWRS
ncbi:hypothetical protein GCM10010983_42780 [Caulobacter rhizosphaerae]|nr:hypothetical protein GCM10010983_42780 [Caulobacter rhizosphaerae]